MRATSFSDDTPEWIRDWTSWTALLLLTDWRISVIMVDKLEEDADHDDLGEDRPGEIVASAENLRAEIKFLKTIKDDDDGHIEVVHELCHAFMCRMSESAKNLISSKVVRKTAWKSYDAAEEESVVKLSRLLVQLRGGQTAVGA